MLDGSHIKDVKRDFALIEKSMNQKTNPISISDFVIADSHKQVFRRDIKATALSRKQSIVNFKSKLAHSVSQSDFKPRLYESDLALRSSNQNNQQSTNLFPLTQPPLMQIQKQPPNFALIALQSSERQNKDQSSTRVTSFDKVDPQVLVSQHKRFVKGNIRLMQKVRADRQICHSSPRKKCADGYEDMLDEQGGYEMLIEL